ncbi:MAG TPA: DUF3108 domain-containing protein [Cellvibrionaceae bacterium]|nr:DUF3108 domain-containing protein [Cellvibrionaceae bacterium]
MRLAQLIIGLCIFVSQICSAAALFSATYKGKYNGWNITLERSLQETNPGQFNLTSKASNFLGQLEEISEFSLANDQLLPSIYTYNRRILGKTNSETIRFAWDTQEAFYTRANKSQDNRTLKLTAGLLDPALYQLQLQRDLARQSVELNYSFVKRKDIKTYRFSPIGGDTFTLNGVPLKATLVERVENSTKKTRIWLLPDLNWQIARIQHKDESGDTYTIELAHYSGDSQLISRFYQKPSTPK